MADVHTPYDYGTQAGGSIADVTPTPVGTPSANTNLTIFKARVDAAKSYVKTFHREWKGNVERRMGRPGAMAMGANAQLQPFNDGSAFQSDINPDWALTKTKIANLYSQVPQVRGEHVNEQYAAAIAPLIKAINYEIGPKRAHVGVAMEEVLNDVVNAAGVGAVVTGYAARYETVQQPQEESINGQAGPIPTASLPPDQLGALEAAGIVHMVPVKRVTSDAFFTKRISPREFLWPPEFIGSDFNDADWLGHRGQMAWGEAVEALNLTEADKENVLTSADPRPDDDLRVQPERGSNTDAKVVKFDRIYYWRYRVDPQEPSFHTIWEMTFVDGLPMERAVDKPWAGQRFDPQTRSYVGACRLPISVLTLTYITDNPVPPSDSMAGRPQVEDLRRSRSQLFQQRARSIPIRGFDTNRVDPMIQDDLMRGTYQNFIPFNGDPSRGIVEVARASYPAEDFTFDGITKADLMETWQIGPNQAGVMAPSGATKAEVQTVQGNFATRIGQERARVAQFFLNIVEVMTGLMALYSDFPILTPQERQAMRQAWDNAHVLHNLVLNILPDSTVMLDSQAKLQRVMNLVNMLGKSPFVNVQPLISEAIELSGYDPAGLVHPPPPLQPEPYKISINGKDDLNNPVVMALLEKNGQAPTAEQIQQAKALLESVDPLAPAIPAPPAGQPGVPPPQPPIPADAHPGWNTMSRVLKRGDAGGQRS